MRALARLVLPALITVGLVACGEAPSTTGSDASAPNVPGTAPAGPPPADARLDTDALRERAAASLAANRLYAPAGDNAVEDYLALRERQPGDAAVALALADLAPYVIIGAEQATAADAFPEAARRIALLARMDAEAPAVPRLREALAAAQADAEARAAAERADAERLAAEAQREAAARATTTATVAPAPTRPPHDGACPRASPRGPRAHRPAPRPQRSRAGGHAAPRTPRRPRTPGPGQPGLAPLSGRRCPPSPGR